MRPVLPCCSTYMPPHRWLAPWPVKFKSSLMFQQLADRHNRHTVTYPQAACLRHHLEVRLALLSPPLLCNSGSGAFCASTPMLFEERQVCVLIDLFCFALCCFGSDHDASMLDVAPACRDSTLKSANQSTSTCWSRPTLPIGSSLRWQGWIRRFFFPSHSEKWAPQ